MRDYLNPDTEARLGIGASSLSGEATKQRLYGVRHALAEAIDTPVLGHGLGYTSIWGYFQGPHNMYLLFLVEGGLLGLTVYLLLIAVLWQSAKGIGRVLTSQIVISSFFSHNHLDQPALLLIMVFIVAHGATSGVGEEAGIRLNGSKAGH
jgi:O-antigen ligase